MTPSDTPCQGLSDEEIAKELKALNERVKQLETMLKRRSEAESKPAEAKHFHSVKGLADRVRRVEERMEEKFLPEKWAERITLSGFVEVEAGYEDMDFSDPVTPDTTTSDITLATAVLGVDVDIAEHVQGHILFLWEEDETEPVDIDEGFIVIDGKDVVPLYLNAGKMYVPFGYFESHFISDPITLEIGETNQSAVKLGWTNGWLDLCAAAFNSDIEEIGEDNRIGGFVGSVRLTLPEGIVEKLTLMAGAAHISNIGDSDGLEGEIPGTVTGHVGGGSAFLSASYKERYFFEAEYVGAVKRFEAGELDFDGGGAFEPRAWNLELAFRPVENLELGVKYEGGDDLGNFLPDKQWGVVFNYNLLANTSLALEYLHGEFENDDSRHLMTIQLGLAF